METRICKKCNLSKPIIKFEECKSHGKIYRLNTCRVCRKMREKQLNPNLKSQDIQRLKEWKNSIRGTIDGFIYSNLYRWRKRSNIKSDLTFDYLKELWNNQNGKCFYTNVALTDFKASTSRRQFSVSNKSRYSPSLDKMTPNLGYVQGNVVWTAHTINTMKNDSTVEEFIKLCKFISDKFQPLV